MAELYMSATLTQHVLPQRLADFSTLSEALDYAAEGETGLNFYDGRCRLTAVVQYGVLRREALKVAKRLHGLGLQRGDRIALIADTDLSFMEIFYGCQYGGFVPVPLPIPSGLGSHDIYVKAQGPAQELRGVSCIRPGRVGEVCGGGSRAADALHWYGQGAIPAPDAKC
ncbi:AMP-binding protein [Pseudomonas asuensis]